jgi:hypothetical protein
MKYRNPATHAAMLALEKNTLNRKHCDIVDTGFIGEGNRKTLRKPPTCRKSLP